MDKPSVHHVIRARSLDVCIVRTLKPTSTSRDGKEDWRVNPHVVLETMKHVETETAPREGSWESLANLREDGLCHGTMRFCQICGCCCRPLFRDVAIALIIPAEKVDRVHKDCSRVRLRQASSRDWSEDVNIAFSILLGWLLQDRRA